MALRAGVGRSLERDATAAGRSAAQAALAQVGGQADAALVFASAGYDQQALLAAIAEVLGEVPLVGCSGEGVISTAASEEASAVVGVCALRGDGVRFHPMLVEGYGDDPRAAGEELARQVNQIDDDEARCLIVLPDGLVGNCTTLLDVLAEQIDVPVVGGTSADQMAFERTHQYCGTHATSEAVAALLVCGAVHVDVAVSHGCAAIGLERTVTRASDGWVYEIDGRPAWDVFKEYLDGDPVDLNAEGIVHLCIGEPLPDDEARGYDPFIIRTPLKVDAETGALFFPGGGLDAGSVMRMTRRDPQRIRESARACASRILEHNSQRAPALVLQFDCAGRGRVLFGSCAADEIVAPLQRELGPETPWLGLHTYGEIAPVAGRPRYHNYTVAICALYDRD
jgi:hypothetical protein